MSFHQRASTVSAASCRSRALPMSMTPSRRRVSGFESLGGAQKPGGGPQVASRLWITLSEA